MAAPTIIKFGALPAVRIDAPDGAQAIVTLYGAQLVLWKTPDGIQRLFCSAKSALDGSRAIRGGVPVIFPQFGERGSGLRHGFARISNWRLADSGHENTGAYAQFTLAPADLPASLVQTWPHPFELTLRVTLHASALELSLQVRNTGAAAFSFCAALHSYFLIDQLNRASLTGLPGQAPIKFSDQLDRIYHGVAGELKLQASARTVCLEQDGFEDTVVWNPGAADAAALVDLADEEYRHFICIEPALINPATLAPGATWLGRQRVRC